MGSWGLVVIMADSLSWLSHGCQDWRIPHVWYFCWVPSPIINDLYSYQIFTIKKMFLQNNCLRHTFHHLPHASDFTYFFPQFFNPLCFGPRPSWTSLATSLNRWFTGGNGLGGFSFLFSHLRVERRGWTYGWHGWIFFAFPIDKTWYNDIRYASIYSHLWIV